jgi:hypothetical protein
MLEIKVYKEELEIELCNDTYGKVLCSQIPEVMPILKDDDGNEVEYLYLQWNDINEYENFYHNLNNQVFEFSEEQNNYLKDLVLNWEQPLGQEGNLTLDQLKTNKYLDNKASFKLKISEITTADISEKDSWKDQEKEALAWLENNDVETPILNALIISRNLDEDIEILVNKIVQNAQTYRDLYFPLLGKYQSINKQIENAENIEDLDNINIEDV